MAIELGIDPLLELAERIRSKRARIGVVGLRYVGLPLLVAAGNAGFETLGFDVDPEKIERLRAGRSYIVDVSDSDVASAEFGEFSSDPAILRRADVLIICVPTPLTDRMPDLSMVHSAAEQIGAHLSPGRLVILESNVSGHDRRARPSDPGGRLGPHRGPALRAGLLAGADRSRPVHAPAGDH